MRYQCPSSRSAFTCSASSAGVIGPPGVEAVGGATALRVLAAVLTAGGASAAGEVAGVLDKVPDGVLTPERATATATLPTALGGAAETVPGAAAPVWASAGGSPAGKLVDESIVFLAALTVAKAMRDIRISQGMIYISIHSTARARRPKAATRAETEERSFTSVSAVAGFACIVQVGNQRGEGKNER